MFSPSADHVDGLLCDGHGRLRLGAARRGSGGLRVPVGASRGIAVVPRGVREMAERSGAGGGEVRKHGVVAAARLYG